MSYYPPPRPGISPPPPPTRNAPPPPQQQGFTQVQPNMRPGIPQPRGRGVPPPVGNPVGNLSNNNNSPQARPSISPRGGALSGSRGGSPQLASGGEVQVTVEKEGRWTFPTLNSLPPPPPFQNLPKKYASGGVGGFIDPPEGGAPKPVLVQVPQDPNAAGRGGAGAVPVSGGMGAPRGRGVGRGGPSPY